MGRIMIGGVLLLLLAAAPAPAQSAAAPPGYARLEITITRTSRAGLKTTILSSLVAIDGKEHEFGSGRQLPMQTRVNFTPTVSYLDATTRFVAALTAFAAGNRQLLAVRARVHDSHVIQQPGLPFAVADGALIDVTRCGGEWLMRNGVTRDLCSWSRGSSAQRTSWKATAKLTWAEDAIRGAVLDATATSTIDAEMQVLTSKGPRVQQVACDVLPPNPARCESEHGKEVPMVTNIGGTRSTNYVDATTHLTVDSKPGGSVELQLQESGLEPPPDLTRVDLTQLSAASTSYEVPAGVSAIDELTVARHGEPAGETSLVLQRFRRNRPAAGMR